jgi:hypothetical protein
VHLRPSPRLAGRMNPSSGSSCLLAPGVIFSWQSGGCTPVTREVITHCLHNPGKQAPRKCCRNLKLKYGTLR